MKALEFKSKIKNNRILIPARIQSKLRSGEDKSVRVIVFLDDPDDVNDEIDFRKVASSEFLKGYSESDSIYDNY